MPHGLILERSKAGSLISVLQNRTTYDSLLIRAVGRLRQWTVITRQCAYACAGGNLQLSSRASKNRPSIKLIGACSKTKPSALNTTSAWPNITLPTSHPPSHHPLRHLSKSRRRPSRLWCRLHQPRPRHLRPPLVRLRRRHPLLRRARPPARSWRASLMRWGRFSYRQAPAHVGSPLRTGLSRTRTYSDLSLMIATPNLLS